jgi:hypothetical protein
MSSNRLITLLAAMLVLALALGCSSGHGSSGASINPVTRHYGGTQRIDLPPGTKLVNATWNQSSLWYVTRPMRPGEEPEEPVMQEDSTFGALQGKVVFVESRP